ncbi:hypothetical protein [Acinetobacter bereziniae]|uniref:hypothetical protein n=1 Tax=Acinetobacter bereziniae TaxID=106648 RepID=UPI003008A0A8
MGKVITPIATSKNEVIVSKAEVTNTKPDMNVYPLQTPVKVENILVNPKTGLKEVKPQETVLDTHAKLNQYDQGKLKPAEAATGAQLESVLGSMKKYEGATTTKNPDWEIISGPNKGKTVDAMYTTDKLSQKEIDGLNKYYEKNMTKGSEKDKIQDHLGKADFVPIDFRVLNPSNQEIFLNYVKTLPKSQQNQFIIMR